MSSLKDEALQTEATDDLDKLEKQLSRTRATSEDRRKEVERLKRIEANLAGENEGLKKALDIATSFSDANIKVPTWVKPKKSKKAAEKHGTPLLMLSDLHLDEVVDPVEVQWWNGYNREIAKIRYERVINKTVEVLKTYVAGIEFDGMVVALGGDIMTGDIHEELARTNEGTIMESIVYWVPVIASGLEFLANELDIPLWLPCVRGNHDRYSKKKPAKKQAQESFSWIIYHWLQDHFRDRSDIEFAIATAADMAFPVYDTQYLLTHGDQFRGGSGIAGIYSPIMKGQYRKQQRNASLGQPFDYMIMGHFHQLIWGQKIIVNGSLKGYDEYAYDNNFEYEPARQALWITTPEKGITMQMPIYAEDPKESWKK